MASPATNAQQVALARRITCPVLVIHGDNDRVIPIPEGRALARTTNGTFVSIPDGTHLPQARKPAY